MNVKLRSACSLVACHSNFSINFSTMNTRGNCPFYNVHKSRDLGKRRFKTHFTCSLSICHPVFHRQTCTILFTQLTSSLFYVSHTRLCVHQKQICEASTKGREFTRQPFARECVGTYFIAVFEVNHDRFMFTIYSELDWAFFRGKHDFTLFPASSLLFVQDFHYLLEGSCWAW